MAYKKKTILETMGYITDGNMYLPAIQRKYVWSEGQMTRLMDSIMQGYPIGTFLFWRVKKSVVNNKDYSMYRFIQDYHERDACNNLRAPAPLVGKLPEIYAVLDGQQRLASLYIALQGSLRLRLPRKHRNNDDAYPKKELYFDLRSKRNEDDEDDITYRFAFLTRKEIDAAKSDAGDPAKPLWFRVKDILVYPSSKDVRTSLVIANGWNTDPVVKRNVILLHRRLVLEKLINYFEICRDSIDEVLDIFVRVNSGGTVLSKSDLIYSTIVSHWDNARDKVDELLSAINRTGKGFRFSNDYIMRTCLYVLDLNISLKVETFGKDSVMRIKDAWEDIENAIKETATLLNGLGFHSENITSYVATMPIVYYKYHGGSFDTGTKKEIQKYCILAQLKQIFGASNTSALNAIRDVLRENIGKKFKLADLQKLRFAGDRTLVYTSDELEELFDTLELGPATFMVLSLLYPNFKFDQLDFHQDHMHPRTGFETEKLTGLKLPDDTVITREKIREWQRLRNTLPNLQLLEGRENESKNKTPLIDWMDDPKNKKNAQYIPKDAGLDLAHFEKFLEARKKLMCKALEEILL